mgnify:CR=1 FL=1|tara:strand:- start:43 stop:759 length:717 start_codon:yes stop_codon:yes gene_type:complete
MEISFFEEFPIESNLRKLELVNFSTKLYLAAKSLNEFNKIKIKNSIYWPVLDKKEGYWISPFSTRKALLRIFNELKNENIPVMLDLELPTTQNPWLYLKSFNFFRNKNLIKSFINNYQGEVYLAEYYPKGKWKEAVLSWLGLHYKNAKIIKMLYHSLHNFSERFVKNELQKGVNEFGKDYLVALGTISVGIHGNDPILSAKQLKQDLRLAKLAGVKEVIIFRLAGLNKRYVKIIEEFL